MWLTFKKRKWNNFNEPKFVFVVRNPIYRAYSEYNSFDIDFPTSMNWTWCNPGSNFEKNINSELLSLNDKTDKKNVCGNFISNGCYVNYITEVIKKLELNEDNFIVVSIDELTGNNAIKYLGELSKFLNIGTVNKIYLENENYYERSIDENVKNKLKNFYKPYNEKLFDLIGREIVEWNNE